jgi:hypothetical protein
LADVLAHVIARIEVQRGKLPRQLAERIAGLKNGLLEHQT